MSSEKLNLSSFNRSLNQSNCCNTAEEQANQIVNAGGPVTGKIEEKLIGLSSLTRLCGHIMIQTSEMKFKEKPWQLWVNLAIRPDVLPDATGIRTCLPDLVLKIGSEQKLSMCDCMSVGQKTAVFQLDLVGCSEKPHLLEVKGQNL